MDANGGSLRVVVAGANGHDARLRFASMEYRCEVDVWGMSSNAPVVWDARYGPHRTL